MKKMKSKLPANVFEAQILEMAGAISGKDDPLDSDDSPYDDDFDDGDADDPEGRTTSGVTRPKLPAEDVETVIKAGNIVPKPLPQVTPDACPSPGPYRYPGFPPRAHSPKGLFGLKRRLSGSRYENFVCCCATH